MIARSHAEWPDEFFWTAIRTGAIHRIRGEYEAALQVLDELARQLGRQTATPVHYHRAMTHNEVGRFEEAIAELDRGLETQPDYMWAFLERACSYAQLGRTWAREAASDQTLFAASVSSKGYWRRTTCNRLRRLATATGTTPTDVAREARCWQDESWRYRANCADKGIEAHRLARGIDDVQLCVPPRRG